MGIWYCTREAVKSALDTKETARNNAQVDRAIENASRAVEQLCHRIFYPEVSTRYFDWPNRQRARAWRLWLDRNEIVSVTAMTSGGVTIPTEDIFLEPVNSGAPYSRIELNVGSAAAFSASQSTWQRSIELSGVFGWPEALTPAGALDGAVSDDAATLDVTNSAAVGVGSLLKIDDEFVGVTERSMIDTGEVSSDLQAQQSAQSITGITAGSVAVGEVLLIDSERVLVVDVADTTLTVRRAWDGSTLAAHTGSPTIYAARRLSVTRAFAGTTAAAHSDAQAVQAHQAPGPVAQLVLAYALDEIQQEGSAYARTVGSGDAQRPVSGGAISRLEKAVYGSYGRTSRTRAV